MILDGIHRSDAGIPFFVVGNPDNPFGRYLQKKYRSDKRIVFIGPVYDLFVLNNLRYHSRIYFHGHSVGGTNPSLLEAMGCQCLVVAHDNEFNRGVLGDDAFYFSTSEEIARLACSCDKASPDSAVMIRNNFEKIRRDYSWEKIIGQYEQAMLDR